MCLNARLSENVWNSRNNPGLLAYTIKSHSSRSRQTETESRRTSAALFGSCAHIKNLNNCSTPSENTPLER